MHYRRTALRQGHNRVVSSDPYVLVPLVAWLASGLAAVALTPRHGAARALCVAGALIFAAAPGIPRWMASDSIHERIERWTRGPYAQNNPRSERLVPNTEARFLTDLDRFMKCFGYLRDCWWSCSNAMQAQRKRNATQRNALRATRAHCSSNF